MFVDLLLMLSIVFKNIGDSRNKDNSYKLKINA